MSVIRINKDDYKATKSAKILIQSSSDWRIFHLYWSRLLPRIHEWVSEPSVTVIMTLKVHQMHFLEQKSIKN